MKLDHFVMNVNKEIQTDINVIEEVRNNKFPYEPKWGKGTRGFKVSNLWIGNEYLEMVRILKKNGGGWIPEWTKRYKEGHRGMICLMLDVDNMDKLVQVLEENNIKITRPQWLEFKWFFNLLTRRMPWRNCYLPFFEGVPFQIGFQEMKDDKSREFMSTYMVPNARENGINGIYKAVIEGAFTENDFALIASVFGEAVQRKKESIVISLYQGQVLELVKSNLYKVNLYTNQGTEHILKIENVNIYS